MRLRASSPRATSSEKYCSISSSPSSPSALAAVARCFSSGRVCSVPGDNEPEVDAGPNFVDCFVKFVCVNVGAVALFAVRMPGSGSSACFCFVGVDEHSVGENLYYSTVEMLAVNACEYFAVVDIGLAEHACEDVKVNLFVDEDEIDLGGVGGWTFSNHTVITLDVEVEYCVDGNVSLKSLRFV